MTKYVVTGGGGFVGKALCKMLRSRGAEVVAIARGEYPELAKMGVTLVRSDIAAPGPEFHKAFSGADAVFHVAAKVDMWGPWKDFYRINFEGTRNVLQSCRTAGVKRFIFTSSPSVIADGKDLCGVDESIPYPREFHAFYPQTKSMAEKLVLEAHGHDGMATIALRPHLIFGPGDTNLIPTILERARAGKLMQIGSGENLSDFTYIDDCVAAHLCALDALERDQSLGGRAYFISQGRPMRLWDFVNRIVTASGLAPIKRRVPAWVARAIARTSEAVCRLFTPTSEPLLTRFLVSEMATSHYFDISAARSKLGFSPRFTVEEGLRLTFATTVL